MFITDTYGTGSTLESLYCELSHVQQRYRHAIAASNVTQDIDILKWAIERSMEGSAAATHYVTRHGARILSMIREKLMLSEYKNHMVA